MDKRRFPIDKSQITGVMAKTYAAIRSSLVWILARVNPSRKAPDDFATRATIPSWEEYEAATNAQILDRMYRNPSGVLYEQPFIDTLMNVRNAEYARKQTRHLVIGFYVLALAGIVSLFMVAPPSSTSPQAEEQKPGTDTAVENTVRLLKEELNLKLQAKDLEIRDLKRQINTLNQGQTELTRQIKSIAKPSSAAARPVTKSSSAPANPPATVKPRKPN